jgi:hypothetical protein
MYKNTIFQLQTGTVGAAYGCDLLFLFFNINIKTSPPSAAPTGG